MNLLMLQMEVYSKLSIQLLAMPLPKLPMVQEYDHLKSFMSLIEFNFLLFEQKDVDKAVQAAKNAFSAWFRMASYGQWNAFILLLIMYRF